MDKEDVEAERAAEGYEDEEYYYAADEYGDVGMKKGDDAADAMEVEGEYYDQDADDYYAEYEDEDEALLASAAKSINGGEGQYSERGHPIGILQGDDGSFALESNASYRAHSLAGGSSGLKLAVGGRPNVGKSSLVNRLLGADRMVVHHEAGTTRDAVTAPLEWNGHTMMVADIAGIRTPQAGGRDREDLDRMAVQRARQMIMSCHAALLVFDAKEGLVRVPHTAP